TPADRPVGAERRASEGGGPLIEQAAAEAVAGAAASESVAAPGQVVGEHTVVDEEAGGDAVEEAAPPGDLAEAADGLVVGELDVGEGQVVGAVVDAPTLRGQPVGDGQAGDLDRSPAAGEVEDAAGAIAADGQLAGTRPEDAQVLADRQFAARQ